MKYTVPIILSIILLAYLYSQKKEVSGMQQKYSELTDKEKSVIIYKGTEMPFSGKYDKFYENGVYTCRQCGSLLYRSEDKFNSGCGWPSFDNEVPGAVTRTPDADGVRVEITCGSCGGHLGHVFEGEHLTDRNVRHCVNSISLDFVPAINIRKAYFAGGCFWGVEYYLEKLEGVLDVSSGYTGGHVKDPSYRQVTTGTTGHYESVEVVYDDRKTDYETIAREFFEIHDPTQSGRQGPDIGQQYGSAVFYGSAGEKATAEKLIAVLKENGYGVATKVLPASEFYRAEDYHQDYYHNNGSKPYCHGKVKRF